MSKNDEKSIYYFKSYNEDIVNTRNQDYKLPNNYKWVKDSILYNICSKIIYALAKIYAFVYSRVVLRIKVENKKILKQYRKQGYFLFGNHTQQLGDIFVPADILRFKKNICYWSTV